MPKLFDPYDLRAIRLPNRMAMSAMTYTRASLVMRFRTDAGLYKPDPTTFYGAGAAGHTDHLTLAAQTTEIK